MHTTTLRYVALGKQSRFQAQTKSCALKLGMPKLLRDDLRVRPMQRSIEPISNHLRLIQENQSEQGTQ